MKDVSKRIGEYMRSKGYNLADVCNLANLNYQKLYSSLYGQTGRELRASELIDLCVFLEIDPRVFKTNKEEEEVAE